MTPPLRRLPEGYVDCGGGNGCRKSAGVPGVTRCGVPLHARGEGDRRAEAGEKAVLFRQARKGEVPRWRA